MLASDRSRQKRGNSGRLCETQLIRQPARGDATDENHPGSDSHSLRSSRNNPEFEEQVPKATIVYVECPYCDGNNVVLFAASDSGLFASEDREIACGYCQSLFRLSESKRARAQI
jgi:hypothetical protein